MVIPGHEISIKDQQILLCDFDAVVREVFSTLCDSLGFVTPSVLMFDEEQNGLRIVKYQIPSTIDTLVRAALKKEIYDIVYPINCTENIFIQCFLKQQVFIGKTVSEMAAPFFNKSTVAFFDHFLNIKMAGVVPAIVSGKSVGVFAFGSRKQDNLSEKEQEFLLGLAKQLGMYLQFSWRMKMAEEKNQVLQKQNETMAQLVDVKRDFLVKIDELLRNLTSEFELTPKRNADIENCLKYLRSVYLISEHLSKRDDLNS